MKKKNKIKLNWPKKERSKSEVAIEKKKEWKEMSGKRPKKIIIWSNRVSSNILCTHMHHLLLLYKEFLLNTSDIAGSLPSTIISYLQGCGCVREEKSKSLGEVRIHWGDQHEIKRNPGEVMEVVNTTPTRYIFILIWISEIPYFEPYGKEFMNEVSRLRGIVIVNFDLVHYVEFEYNNRIPLNVIQNLMCRVRVIGFDGCDFSNISELICSKGNHGLCALYYGLVGVCYHQDFGALGISMFVLHDLVSLQDIQGGGDVGMKEQEDYYYIYKLYEQGILE